MTSLPTKGILYCFSLSLVVVTVFAVAHVPSVHAADASLGVTQITAVQTSATADNTFANGWKWVFDVTVPLDETLLQMKFADWTNSVGTIPTTGNVRFYSAQSSDAFNEDNARTLTQADAYGSTVIHLDSSKDLNLTQGGRQVQVTVETKVPTGTAGGSYSTSYGINTEHDPSLPVDNGTIAVSEDSSDPATGMIVVNSSNVTQNVPVLAFKLSNTNNSSTAINSLIFDVATSSYATTTSIINNATLVVNGQSYSGTISNIGGTNSPSSISFSFRSNDFIVPGNSSVVGTLKIDLASQSNYSTLVSPSFTFSLPAAGITAENAESYSPLTNTDITGTAIGHAQTLTTSGVSVVADSASVVSSPAASGVSAYNTYTIKFDVVAVQNDAFIPTTASTSASATTGAVFVLAGSSFTGSTTASLSSTADTSTAGYYKVPAGSTRTFTLTVVLKPGTGQSGIYEVDLSRIQFDTTAVAPTQVFTIDSSNSGFKTNPTYAAN